MREVWMVPVEKVVTKEPEPIPPSGILGCIMAALLVAFFVWCHGVYFGSSRPETAPGDVTPGGPPPAEIVALPPPAFIEREEGAR